MKSNTSFLKILFLFLTVPIFNSCEPSEVTDEIQNIEDNEWSIQAIDRDEVEDPGDRGDK